MERGHCNSCCEKYQNSLIFNNWSVSRNYPRPYSDFFMSIHYGCEKCIRKFIYIDGKIPIHFHNIIIENKGYTYFFDHFHILKTLLECGMNPNVIDKNKNENLLHKLFNFDEGIFSLNVSFDEYLEITQMLKKLRIPILKLLLEYKVNPFLVNKNGDDTFEVARKNGYQLYELEYPEIEEFFNLECEFSIKEPDC